MPSTISADVCPPWSTCDGRPRRACGLGGWPRAHLSVSLPRRTPRPINADLGTAARQVGGGRVHAYNNRGDTRKHVLHRYGMDGTRHALGGWGTYALLSDAPGS